MKIDFHSQRPEIPGPKGHCDRIACQDPLKWQIGLLMFAPLRFGNHPVPGEISLYLCDRHAREVTIDEILTDDRWKAITDGFRIAGKVIPDRRLTKIQLLPILNL